MTEEFVKKLRLNTNNINVLVNDINGQINYYTKSIETKFKSKTNKFNSDLKFILLRSWPEALPSQHIATIYLYRHIPSKINLADPNFNKPDAIDAFLGAEIFYNLLCDSQISIAKTGAVLQKTQLSWIIGGN